jgi:hypothetical protein
MHHQIEHVPLPEWWVSLIYIVVVLGFVTFWLWLATKGEPWRKR